MSKTNTLRNIFLAAVAAVMTAAAGCSSDDAGYAQNVGSRVDEELLLLVDRLRGPVVVAHRETGDYQAAEEELEALIESDRPDEEIVGELLAQYPNAKKKIEPLDPYQLQTAAEHILLGDLAGAQIMYGIYYAHEASPHRDLGKAVDYFKKAAGKSVDAPTLIAECYMQGGPGLSRNYAEAVKWYEEAAKLGDKNAAELIGECYITGGYGLKRNIREGLKWYRTAAEQGNGRAMYRLGECYEYGIGVEQDLKQAVEWYDKAWQNHVGMGWFGIKRCYAKGSPDAMTLLAYLIEENATFLSHPYEERFEKAAELYRRATAMKDPKAAIRLAEMKVDGLGGLRDYFEAFELYKTAAEQGDVVGMVRVANCYRDGTGVGRDLEKALEWYKKAADKGNVDAIRNIGFIYEKTDTREALKWFRLGSEKGDAGSANSIGEIYERKFNDMPEAIKWYQLAAERGHIGAQYHIADLIKEGKVVGQSENDASAGAAGADAGAGFETYLELAEKNNNLDAMLKVAACYETGTGVAQSDEEAIKWYLRGLGVPDVYGATFDDLLHQFNGDDAFRIRNRTPERANVMYKLGRYYEEGRGAKKNMGRAAFWYYQAAFWSTRVNDWAPAAWYKMGEFFEKGIGVDKDPHQAITCYASAGDYPGAKEAVRRVREENGIRTDFEIWQEAAERGETYAMENLGESYINGWYDVEKDPEKGFEWLLKAAELGHTLAQYQVGNYYLKGEIVPKDETEGVKWLKKASAMNGDPDQPFKDAIRTLGTYYILHKDYKEAIEWYKKVDSAFEIARCCDLLGDEAAAFPWYRKAAEKDSGNVYILYLLGLRYFYGKGTEVDYAKATRLFSDAGDNVGSLYHLGLCYEKGLGVPQDPKKAFHYFSEAPTVATNPHTEYLPEALEKLAECYENGIGVEKNPAKAAEVKKDADAMRRQREAFPLPDTDPFNRYAEF